MAIRQEGKGSPKGRVCLPVRRSKEGKDPWGTRTCQDPNPGWGRRISTRGRNLFTQERFRDTGVEPTPNIRSRRSLLIYPVTTPRHSRVGRGVKTSISHFVWTSKDTRRVGPVSVFLLTETFHSGSQGPPGSLMVLVPCRGRGSPRRSPKKG